MDVSGRTPFSVVPCASCQTPLTVPLMLGAFLLVERMGTGGMGSVYRALDTALNRFVAIKVMKAALGEDAKLVASFIREAQAAAALNHRNIVQIYSCGQENGQPYIVMELVTGGKMNHLFSRTEPMDEVKLLKIALDVAEGLKAANEVGLVHGDIKPENVLIDQAGTAKIVDFGLAQFVNAQKDRGEIWGTPYYISPERARGNKADHRSDIYSLGATMFHALAGKPPFDGDSAVDVVLARLKHPPPSLHELRPELQKETVDLIERMMAVDPYLRYPNSASLKSDMNAALAAAKAARSAAKPKARTSNRASWVIAGAAAALLVGLGFVLVSHVRKDAADPVIAPRPTAPDAAGTTTTGAAESAASEPEEVIVRREEVTGADGKTRIRVSTDFFTPDETRRLVAALAALDGDVPMEAQRRLDAFGKQLPRGSVRAMWIPLLEALPLWMAGENKRADSSLELVAKFIVRHPEGHPAHMPQVLAREVSGQIKPGAVNKLRSDWPAWFDDLRRLMSGAQALAGGDTDLARRDLAAFLAHPDGQPEWVAAMRPAVRRWLLALERLDDTRRAVRLHLDARRPELARRELLTYRVDALPVLADAALDMGRAVEAMEKEQEVAARDTAARAHRLRVQRDLDRVDAALAEQSVLLLRNRDFRRASLSVSTLPSDMTAPEGRMAAQWVREQFDRLEALKAFLVRAIEQQPFTRADGSDLGGDVISASALGVRATLDGRTVITHTWDALSPRTFIRMAEFYTALPRLAEKERAEALVGLALFSAMNGAFEPAQNYARRAVALDPGIQPIVRRALPGLVAETAPPAAN